MSPISGSQTGIETGSPRLIAKHMRGKPAPAAPDEWPEIVVQALGLLHDQNWVIAGTLVTGLPGETEDDVHGEPGTDGPDTGAPGARGTVTTSSRWTRPGSRITTHSPQIR